jgi:hypothetical protein
MYPSQFKKLMTASRLSTLSIISIVTSAPEGAGSLAVSPRVTRAVLFLLCESQPHSLQHNPGH